ncbi:hypothetical protein COV06_01145 [Candidatus Uhrbacteria bacterium CG10_big_fil_rev_8_21_14_0_10_50_16]|uniref:Potassium channel domain-containing protein n=1 Tax=Candidatus Uhrbacteria bacterium CG10_big_fil_rev_8_21_14_0_10_50_16 TaxID=1975039 RepID=A0A2H0RN64_9BACT|nr:MAG: hypothetical protein COV06_01145 [Candidatus Uhrbacteria bacterium CG10_big_fil_rev_8_21_14_0_10_50_16]
MNTITNQFVKRIFLIFVVLAALLVGGTIIFQRLENWTWIQAFYFSVATVTTVGYGDLAPSSDTSRLVTSVYALLSIPLLLFGIGIVGELVFARYHDQMSIRGRITKKRRKK